MIFMGDETYLEIIAGCGPGFCEHFGGYALEKVRGTDLVTAERRLHIVRETVLVADFVDDLRTVQPLDTADLQKKQTLNLHRIRPYSRLMEDLDWGAPFTDLFESGLVLRLKQAVVDVGAFHNYDYSLRDCVDYVLSRLHPCNISPPVFVHNT